MTKEVQVVDKVARWLIEYAAVTQREEEIENLVVLIDDEITRQLPDLAADEGLRADLHASTRSHWRGFLANLGRETFEAEAPAEAVDLAKTIARRGGDIGLILQIYQQGQRVVWTYINGVLEERVDDPQLRSEILVRFWDRVTIWLDTTVITLVRSYADERELLQRGALARRSALVQSVLRGDPVRERDASAELGHPLLHHHSALALWTDVTSDADTTSTLEALAMRCAQALRGGKPLTVASGARGLWAWVPTKTSPDLSPLVSLSDTLREAGVFLAVGSPAPGIEGFVTSHREALAAQRLAASAPAPVPVTIYPDVELVSLMAGDSAAARAFVRRTLGELAGGDKAHERLRETLHTFLTNGSDIERTAEKLIVHRNTVRYRLGQAEELLGHPVREEAAALEMALRYMEFFGADWAPIGTADNVGRQR